MLNYQCRGKSYYMQNYQCLTSTLIILHITKTESNNCFIIHFKWEKPKTKSNNCLIIDLKPKIISMAHKTIIID